MPAINQLVRKGRHPVVDKTKVPALGQPPQKRVLAPMFRRNGFK